MPAASPVPAALLPAFLAAAKAEGPGIHVLCLAGLAWGFRVTELLALRVGHVCDPWGKMKSTVSLERAALKFGRNETLRRKVRSRAVPVPPDLQHAIREYLFSRFGAGPFPADEPLIAGRFAGEPMCRMTVHRIIRRLATTVGLDESRTWSSHSFRKSFARSVYDATGHDIIRTQRALGHSHVTTTQHYLPIDGEEVMDAMVAAQVSLTRAPTLPNTSTLVPFTA